MFIFSLIRTTLSFLSLAGGMFIQHSPEMIKEITSLLSFLKF
jgi:hypothetical protein